MPPKAFHPREILKTMYLEPLHINLTDLAQAMSPDPALAKRLLSDELHITAELALYLSRIFSTTPEFWMNMQASYDLQQARASPVVRERLEKIKPIPTTSNTVQGKDGT